MEQGLVTRGGKVSERPKAGATGLSRRGWGRRSRVCSRHVDFVGLWGQVEAALRRLKRLAGAWERVRLQVLCLGTCHINVLSDTQPT